MEEIKNLNNLFFPFHRDLNCFASLPQPGLDRGKWRALSKLEGSQFRFPRKFIHNRRSLSLSDSISSVAPPVKSAPRDGLLPTKSDKRVPSRSALCTARDPRLPDGANVAKSIDRAVRVHKRVIYRAIVTVIRARSFE